MTLADPVHHRPASMSPRVGRHRPATPSGGFSAGPGSTWAKARARRSLADWHSTRTAVLAHGDGQDVTSLARSHALLNVHGTRPLSPVCSTRALPLRLSGSTETSD